MSGLLKLVIASVAVITSGSIVAVLFVPPSPQERAVRRQAEAQRLVDQLTQSIWNYRGERGEFPPGDGIGSAGLVRALRMASRSGFPYMLFVKEMLTDVEDLRNPVAPHTAILYYRNNVECSEAPGLHHNRGSFDLWGRSPDGHQDGINNWDSIVPYP